MADGPRILIAAGGTGGHIFPALNVAAALKRREPDVTIAFVGSGRPLEQKLIDGAGYTRYVLPATRIMQQGPLGLLRFAATAPYGLWRARGLFRTFNPDVVVGMGGYVSVIPVTAAALCGIPTWIHEAERHPGLANKLLGLYATNVSTAFAKTEMLRKRSVVHTGHPVRAELAGIAEMAIPEDAPNKLLVVGGSQGARAIDAALVELAALLKELGISIRHQTREENCENVREAYKGAGVEALVEPFITDMAGAFRAADIVISRAGASAVSELEVVNRPSVLVPYPFAQGGHQRENASALIDAGKAILVEEGARFSERLAAALKVLCDKKTYRDMRSKPAQKIALSAADTIAKGLFALAEKS